MLKPLQMKSILTGLFVLITITQCFSQSPKPDFGTCFSKQNKRSIQNKLDNFLTRVSEETNCPKEKLTYTVAEFYTAFYGKSCRHLPKRITFEACGGKYTYRHNGLSGAVLHWLLGSWTLEK
jgi:hypothetical protein